MLEIKFINHGETHTHLQTHYNYHNTVEHQTAHRCNKKHRNINVEMKECKNANKVKETTRVKVKIRIKRPKLTKRCANIQKIRLLMMFGVL